MSRSKKLIVSVLFLIGACILLYPAVSNKLAERHQAEMIGNYAKTVGELPKADLKAEWEKAVKYNESVTGTSVEDPFILGSGSVLPDNYKDVLNVEEKEGVMGYIEIPAIDVKIPIYHGVSEKVLRKGVGHMETTALPIGGKGTHSVLAAHRGLSTAKLFTDLDKMKEGDLFYIHVLDHLLTYEVDQILVIEPEDTDALRPEADKEYVTLLTCTPYGVNSHRLLVRGEKTSDEIVEENDVKEQDAVKKTRDMTEIIAYAAAAFALFSLFAAVVTICIRKIRKKRRRIRGRRKKAGKKSGVQRRRR
jgi:sortase A